MVQIRSAKDVKSYTAAGVYPAKLHLNKILYSGRIIPLHIQLNPTNICNLKCSFCSCSKRDKELNLDFLSAQEIVNTFSSLGTRAVTITGGGEPLLYPWINELIEYMAVVGIKVGLVTNGLVLERLMPEVLRYLTWVRISFSDERVWNSLFDRVLIEAVERANGSVDWAFSYVLNGKRNWDNIEQVVKFANTNDFTHVRMVSDLLSVEKKESVDMEALEGGMRELALDDRRVIYQDRKHFEPGTKKCWISLLKPVIGADGHLYPCCGTQYALIKPSLDYSGEMRMVEQKDIMEHFFKNLPFDGSKCVRCYYSGYNLLLDKFLREGQGEISTMDLVHKEFV